jgi:hypothetical protein
MAAATPVNTSYGWRVTGGTDSTVVTLNNIWVKRFAFYAVSSDDAATISNKKGVEKFKIPGPVAKTLYIFDVGGDSGALFEGITITLTAATDILYIFEN